MCLNCIFNYYSSGSERGFHVFRFVTCSCVGEDCLIPAAARNYLLFDDIDLRKPSFGSSFNPFPAGG